MNIALLTGTAYRHTYFANRIMEHYPVALHVRVQRSNSISAEIKIPRGSPSDMELLENHDAARLEKEKQYFLPLGERFKAAENIIEISEDSLNTIEVVDRIKGMKLDAVFVYGTGLIKQELLSLLPKIVINLHAGLSPQYRGSATLYWPIYFMEPQSVGFTFHLIDSRIDHGAIVHQGRPEIKSGDQIHDLGCKTIITAAQDAIKILEKLEKGEIRYFEQKSTGKIFYTGDFKPYHLRVTDFLMKNGLIEEYLNHKERFPDPKIIFQV